MPANTQREKISGRGKTSPTKRAIRLPSNGSIGLAAQGHATSLWQIATMKYNGVGTSKDLPGAIEHHRKAAELGHVDAMYYFGVIHADGNAVPQNYAASLQWLNKAASHEDPYGSNPLRSRAQNALGALYENGQGVSRDLLIAYALYNLAAAAGDEKAKESASRVAGQLKPEQLLEAQSLAREWKPGSPMVRRSGNSAS